MIDTALKAAILTAINDLQTATLIPAVTTQEGLIGALQHTNAVCRAHKTGQVKKELDHLIQATSVVSGPYIKMGYTQAALEALS